MGFKYGKIFFKHSYLPCSNIEKMLNKLSSLREAVISLNFIKVSDISSTDVISISTKDLIFTNCSSVNIFLSRLHLTSLTTKEKDL